MDHTGVSMLITYLLIVQDVLKETTGFNYD